MELRSFIHDQTVPHERRHVLTRTISTEATNEYPDFRAELRTDRRCLGQDVKNRGSIENFLWMHADKDTVMQMRGVLRQVSFMYGKDVT